MYVQQSFEVIRFVGQNGKYHIVMDSVEGELLVSYLHKQESMSKRFFLRFVTNLAKELEYLEKSNAAEYVPYLTPFHVVLKENNSVAFLKCSERYNKKIEKTLEQFLPIDGTENYYYSFGRMLQYILMKMRLRPHLTKGEERRIRRIIAKCMTLKQKKQFHSAEEIRAKLVTIRKRKRASTVENCFAL